MKTRKRSSESGVILIVVLAGILILSMIAFALASSVRTGTEELHNRKEHLQAYYLARGAIITTSWLLTQMSPAPDSVLHPGQRSIEWQQKTGTVHVDLMDETGKIDINQAPEPLLENLLLALGYDLGVARPLATAMVEWRDPTSLARWESAQDSGNLLELDLLRSTGYQYHAVEELLNVPGMTPAIFYGHYVRSDDGKIARVPGLLDCITVDSGTTSININYAPYPVLVAATEMNTQAADYIVAGRDQQPFVSIDAVTSEFPVSLGSGAQATLTTQNSDVFSILATGRTQTGITAGIQAVVKVQGTTARPFQMLHWKDSHVQ